MIVMKFGGTSVESAAAIERVASIVRGQSDRKPVVVVSAMGKTTNKLLDCANLAAGGQLEEAWEASRELERFHEREAHAITRNEDQHDLENYLKTRFAEIRSLLGSIHNDLEITPLLWDEITSYGERLSSYIVTLAFRYFGLPAQFVDSRQVVVTDSRHTQALPLYNRTYARLQEKLPPLLEKGIVVMGGFIGSTSDGVTSTLGRGGSDFSAAIVGAGLTAEEIQIWTDVDGMLTCDPRILPGGHLIKSISFSEAAELAYFGAKVLHPATVLPAVEKNIPVRVLNSRRPEAVGTRIVGDVVHAENPVKSIACKRGITIVNIQSLRMLMAHGFLRRIFEVFDRYRTAVDVVTTSEVSVSLTIDDDRNLPDIEEELRQIAGVNLVRGQALVCLVGEAIRETSGISARAFAALKDINVRMVSQGASLLNITFVVEDADLTKAVAALHEEFFRALDPEVFEQSAVTA